MKYYSISWMDQLKTITELFMYYYSVPGLEPTASHDCIHLFSHLFYELQLHYIWRNWESEKLTTLASHTIGQGSKNWVGNVYLYLERQEGDSMCPERGEISGKKGCDFRCNFHTEASAASWFSLLQRWIKNKITQKPLCQGIEVIGKRSRFLWLGM